MTILQQLTDEQVEQLIADHWREIKGLLREQERRRGNKVPQPDGKPLDNRRRDGRASGPSI